MSGFLWSCVEIGLGRPKKLTPNQIVDPKFVTWNVLPKTCDPKFLYPIYIYWGYIKTSLLAHMLLFWFVSDSWGFAIFVKRPPPSWRNDDHHINVSLLSIRNYFKLNLILHKEQSRSMVLHLKKNRVYVLLLQDPSVITLTCPDLPSKCVRRVSTLSVELMKFIFF